MRIASALGWVLALALWIAFASRTAHAQDAASASAKEQDLKAAYIYNFAKFTEWPAESFNDATGPLVIGVVGDERVAASLATLTRSRALNGHPIEVRLLSGMPLPPEVRILFIAGSQDAALPRLAGAFQATGLLTIGETESFARAGGIIRLVVDSSRLQFEIDNARAEKAGVTLSSQLLMLARKVRKSL
jgi:hypothetical protein